MIEVLADAGLLSDLVTEWFAESAEALASLGIPKDKDVCMRNLQVFCDSPNIDVLVSKQEGKITGMMILVIQPNILGPGLFAAEQYFYVLPKYRGMAGIRLMDAADKWAKDRGCSHLAMSASKAASKLFDKVCKLYEFHGMVPIEAAYIKQL